MSVIGFADMALPLGRRSCRQVRQSPPSASFDHLVGAQEKRCWQINAECLGGFQVNYRLEFGRLFKGKVSRLGTFENFVDKRSGLPERLGKVPP